MCSTVHFTYRCGCADRVVFKCPLLHHCALQNPDDARHCHQQEGGGEEERQVETATNDIGDDTQQQQTLDEGSSETPVPLPIVITMDTGLDEECQDCAANRHSATTAAKLDDDIDEDSASSDSQEQGVPRSPRPLAVREEVEVAADAVGDMPPPPPPLPRIPLAPIQQRQMRRRPRFQPRRENVRSGLREISLNMV